MKIIQKIPIALYKKIHDNMPIVCVDAVIVQNGRFLMGKRKNRPEKDKWWLLGGRVYKGEKLKDAITRKVKEEAGLDIKVIKCLGSDEFMAEDGPFDGSTHTVGVVFLVKPIDKKQKIKTDAQHDKLQWFSEIDQDWHPYCKKFLKLRIIT